MGACLLGSCLHMCMPVMIMHAYVCACQEYAFPCAHT